MKNVVSFCFFSVIYTMVFSAFNTVNAAIDTLDQDIVKSESRFTDIVDGAEKNIRWFNNQKRKTEYSIIYLHGFSASRQELTPTTEMVADNIGANVFYTRLTGHGRSDDAMADADVLAWKKDAFEALRIGTQIGHKVIIVSASTGGTLATWLMTQPQAKSLVGNVMISPNFGVKSSAAKIINWPFGLTIAKWISGDYNSFTPVSEKHAKYWTERYPLEAVVPMLDLVDEVDALDKGKIAIPQLFIYSPQDMVVDVDMIKETATQFSSAPVSVYPFTVSKDHVQHVLSGDACSPESTQTMVDLITSYINNGFTLP